MVAAAMLMTAWTSPAVARRESTSSKPRIEIRSMGFHVDVARLPISEVLQLVAETTGARVFLHGDGQEKISAQFVDVSIADGLRRLLRGRDLMIFYKESAKGAHPPVLTEVHVFDAFGAQSDRLFQFASSAESSSNSRSHRVGQSGRKILDARLVGLVKQMLESKDSQQKIDAAKALARTGDSEAIDVLGQALAHDNDPSVREAIADALGKSWNEAAVAPLAQSLTDDRSAAVRAAAAAALGTTWSEGAVNPLLQALANDRDALVREQAARALGSTAGEEAVAVLARTLAQDPRWFVREAAAIAIGSIGGNDARDALVRAAETDSDPWVKEAGLMSILDLAK